MTDNKIRHFKRCYIVETPKRFIFLELGEMEIWDGADLALLRETLWQVVTNEGFKRICIRLSYVKYLPSGFFGMLYEWMDKTGVQLYLTPPQPNVQRMVWFRMYFKLNEDGNYEMWRDPPLLALGNEGANVDSPSEPNYGQVGKIPSRPACPKETDNKPKEALGGIPRMGRGKRKKEMNLLTS